MNQRVFQGKHYRISILTNQLVRLEYSQAGIFEDRPTQTVLNRDFSEVAVTFQNEEEQRI